MDVSVTMRPTALTQRRWFLAALLLLVLGLGVQYTLKAADDRSAFVRWRNQLHDLGRGVDIYQAYIYPNAPIMALLLYPLAEVEDRSILGFTVPAGALAWFFLKIGLTVLAFYWAFRLIEEKDRPFPAWAKAATILVSLRPIVGDLSHGNVNLLILFLVVAALYAFKRGKDVIAGLTLALAITCKVTPALFVPYFLWKRAWKTVAACLIGMALLFVVVPGAILGPAHNWKLLNSWVEKMILPFTVGGEVTTEHCNQSLPGLIYRLGTNSPSFLDENDRPAEFHNFASLDPATARMLLKVLGIGFLVLLAWSSRTRIQCRDDWRLSAEFAIVVLGMLLFSERTWKHHCVTLVLPFGVLCYCIAACRPSTGMRNYLIGSIAASLLVMATTSTTLWEPFGYKLGAKMAQVYGAFVWAELILVAALVVLLWRYRDGGTTPGHFTTEPGSQPS